MRFEKGALAASRVALDRLSACQRADFPSLRAACNRLASHKHGTVGSGMRGLLPEPIKRIAVPASAADLITVDATELRLLYGRGRGAGRSAVRASSRDRR